ncbi:hypothetical protein Agub_g15081 [Astrephomene gubernaculifera]|uniref:Uncharacterized protein n=1 Tax=Astrephomene gubernaculifera TaxID=47775 RepID=A0AAD3HTM0_9CHLO|nr:hypothetical protein Agub_g15081 [Astrephomene gubernaculifera]
MQLASCGKWSQKVPQAEDGNARPLPFPASSSMQREETTVLLGPLRIRLLQRPQEVPPEPASTAESACNNNNHLQQSPQPEHSPQPQPSPPTQPLPSEADCLLGWELWPAAYRLAAFLACGYGAETVRNATAIVELGAGLGLPGIVAAKVGASRVTLTDLPQALPLLEANVQLNDVSSACHTAVLDWAAVAAVAGGAKQDPTASGTVAATLAAEGSEALTTASEGYVIRQEKANTHGNKLAVNEQQQPSACEHLGRYDVVLAADVVYVSSLAPLLADTIAAVAASQGPCTVLVGHTVRKSVWLDRTTGAVCVDPTDEPWEAFQGRMTGAHGFTCRRAETDQEGLAAAAAAAAEEEEGSGAGFELAPDTFVCVFERCL